MFCPKCGSEIKDESKFCSSCGAPVKSSTDEEVADASDSNLAQENEPHQMNKKLLIGLIVAGALAIIAVIVVIVLYNIDQANKADQALHQEHNVTITINAEGYTADDTLIPIHITGTDLDGKLVDQMSFVDARGQGITLRKGVYKLQVVASPLTTDGIVYTFSDTALSLVVPDDLQNGADFDATSLISIALAKSTLLDETPEMITNAYNAAIKEPAQANKAASLYELTNRLHEEAVAQKEAEEKAIEMRRNPASIMATEGRIVTLKGKLIRQQRTTDETGMGWSSVDYILVFDSPVDITYSGSHYDGATTNVFDRIQVASEERLADDPTDLSSITLPEYQPYVGQYVAVSGIISHTGNAHTYGNARFITVTSIVVL